MIGFCDLHYAIKSFFLVITLVLKMLFKMSEKLRRTN